MTKSTNKLLERIRRLLAMGGDLSSVNEAAIALKRARSLMDAHQITMMEVKASEPTDLGILNYGTNSTKQKPWMTRLALDIAMLNDCIAEFSTRQSRSDRLTYEFKGFNDDVDLCKFMMSYLVDTAERLYSQDRVELKLKGAIAKNDYLYGFSMRIHERIQDEIQNRFSAQPIHGSQSLITIKSSIVAHRWGEQRINGYYKQRELEDNAYAAGEGAAKDVHLGKFINGEPRAALVS